MKNKLVNGLLACMVSRMLTTKPASTIITRKAREEKNMVRFSRTITLVGVETNSRMFQKNGVFHNRYARKSVLRFPDI